MDDPMRGVDIGTKLEVYDLIRGEAAAGRTFLWYTTETGGAAAIATTSMSSATARIVADLGARRTHRGAASSSPPSQEVA